MRKSILLALAVSMTTPAFVSAVPAVSVGFSPSDGQSALEVVLNGIKSARNSIDVAAYSFTSKPVAMALVSASKRGVAIRVVADKKANNDRYTAVTFLANQGLSVRLNSQYAIMHNKFMVIDGNTVQTGSFNYSASAAKRNAENALLVQCSPELATAYLREFNRLWDESDALASRY